MSHPKLFKVPHFILVMEDILHLLVVDVYIYIFNSLFTQFFYMPAGFFRICFQQFQRLSVRGWRFQFQDLFRQMPSIRLGISQVGWKGITAMVGIDTLAIWIRVHYKEKQAKLNRHRILHVSTGKKIIFNQAMVRGYGWCANLRRLVRKRVSLVGIWGN